MAYIRKLSSRSYRAEIRRKYTFIQAKTFSSLTQAQFWADEVESNIQTILDIKPKKLKKLSPEKVNALGGVELFQKLGVEVKFVTFRMLANEYMLQWVGKDKNQIHRAAYWLDIFGDTPIKSIKPKCARQTF